MPELIRKVHGSAEGMAAEYHELNQLAAEEHEIAMNSHVPPILGMLSEALYQRQNMSVGERVMKYGFSDKRVISAGEAWMLVAFRIGYRAANEGMDFEPCFCDLSKEQFEHYKKLLEELLEDI